MKKVIVRRKARNGGVLDTVPEGAQVRPGSLQVVDGKRYLSLTDGRIVRSPHEVIRFTPKGVVRKVIG